MADSFDSFKPSKYFKTTDVEDGPLTFTIASFGKEEIGESKDKLCVMHVEEDERGVICKTENLELLKEAYGSPSKAVGQKVELFKTTTKFGAKKVACLRIRKPGTEAGTAKDSPF